MAKINLKNKADELFKSYPEKTRVFMTTDGQGFWSKNHANNHAAKNKLDAPQEFFRSGYEVEADTSLEEALVEAEEKALTAENVLNAIQDAANVEAEELQEIPEDAHEALKAVGELRAAHDEKVSLLADAAGDIGDYNALKANLASLVKGNDTKLAKEIIKLLPVETED
jgi:hypothetical protein